MKKWNLIVVIGLFNSCLAKGEPVNFQPQIRNIMENQYSEQEFDVTSFDGTPLRGTLSAFDKPNAVVITVHGSFNQDRNGDLDSSSKWMYPEGAPKRRLFYDMAHELSHISVATYRYDKRASGKSEGVYADTTLTVLAKDLSTIVAVMRDRFPGLPVGVIGQSEGCLVTLKAYDLGMRPDFILLQSPALLPFDKILDYQKTRAAAPFLQDADGNLAKRYPYVSAFYKAMYEGDMLDKIRNTSEKYYRFQNGQWSAMSSLEKYREYMWSGLELLKNVRVPVEIFFGTKDLNVIPEVAETIEKEKLNHDLYQNVTILQLEGLEHSFRELKDCEGFFEALSKPVSPTYLKALKASILRAISKKKAFKN